jgi:hypothetical protein
MGGARSAHDGDINAYRIVVGKSGGKKQLGIPKCRWEDDIKICLKNIGWESVN